MPGPAQTPNKPQYRSPPSPLEGLRCHCPENDLAVRRISRSAQNPDRPFWCCKRERRDPNHCGFFKWEDDISAAPTASGGPDSNNRPRSPSSARQDSPRKMAILETLLSEEPQTPSKPKASQIPSVALWGHLGEANDDDDESFYRSQVFKFNPLGGKDRSQASPSTAPAISTPLTTNGLMLNTPRDTASRKGKTKDKQLFDPLESPTSKARDSVRASASSWSPSSLLDYQSPVRPSQETDNDDPAVYVNAVKKLDGLPAYINQLQKRVFEAETAKNAAELKLREYEEHSRALQMENEHLNARQGF